MLITSNAPLGRGYARLIAARILAFLQEFPSGLSTHEVAQRLALPYTTVAPRLSELRRDGQVRASGCRTRNESGFTANVWVPCMEGAGDTRRLYDATGETS